MKISFLLDQLKDYEYSWLIRNNSYEEIFTFQPYDEDKRFLENMLYVSETLPETPYTENANITIFFFSKDFVTDSKNSFVKNSINCNIIALKQRSTKQELFDYLNQCFLEETRHINNINHMFVVSNEDRGLQDLVDEAYLIMKSPIIIIDTSYKILAMYNNNLSIESRPDLEAQREMGYLTDQNIQSLKDDKIYEKLRASDYPFYNKIKDEKYGWLNTLVHIHGIEVAEIGMLENDHEFTTYDFEFLNFFRQLVSLEMQKNDFYKNNRGVMHSIFLSDLLDRKIPNAEIIKMRKKQLGWITKPFYFILTIFDTATNVSRNRPQIISYQIQNLIPFSHWVFYGGRLIFLITQDTDDTDLFKEDGVLAKTLNINKLKAVLSNPFDDLLDAHKFFKQTTTIFHLCNRIGEEKTLCLYSDYMFYHIGQILSETYELKDFYHPAIPKMIEYDAKNQSHFIETLIEYLINIDNPTLCSKHLFIHKNTFFYRMNKIRDLFHLDLNDGIERLKLHLTLELMKLESKEV